MATYYPAFIASRILYDADRTGAANENVNVTNWDKAAKFILCVQMGYNGKDTAASAYKWQWRNDTDNPGGVYSDVASTGEIKWAGTSAVLVDGNAVDDAGDDRRCSAVSGQTWQDGLENVGDNLTPDSGTFDLGNDSYTEFQAAFDPADAHAGDTYSFWLYNNTAGAAVNGGTYVTLTIAIAAQQFEEFPADTINLSDSPTKSIVTPRADSVTMSDGFAKVYYKYLADSLSLSDGYGDVAAFARTLPDTVSLSDNFGRIASFARSEGDTINLSDGFSRDAAFVRGLSDTVDLTDGFGKANIFNRGLGDTVNLSDAVTKSPCLSRADAITLSDEYNRAIAYLRTFPDTVSLSDGIAKSVSFSKADTINLADEITGMVRSLLLNLNDTINLSDNYSRMVAFVKGLADTVNISDSLGKEIRLPKADAITLSDLIAKAAGLSRADTATLSDAIIKASGVNLSDTVTLSDEIISKVITLLLSLSDTINLSDSRAFIFAKPLYDSTALADAIAKQFGTGKADAITVSDDLVSMVLTVVGLTLNLSDTISLSDAITKKTELSKADIATLADNYTKVAGYIKALTDIITLSDSADTVFAPAQGGVGAKIKSGILAGGLKVNAGSAANINIGMGVNL